MGRRRQAREIALQALYVADAAGLAGPEAFSIVNRREKLDDEKTSEFARELFDGTSAKTQELDAYIQARAENWTTARMACVDRNVLRLASYELIYLADTPVNVVIDEAIEIARKFSTEDSTKFINGILDKIKALRPKGAEKTIVPPPKAPKPSPKGRASGNRPPTGGGFSVGGADQLHDPQENPG